MENYLRNFESTFNESGDIEGRVLAFDKEYKADGMTEVIPKDCEIEISKNCMALLSHKKENMLGRKDKNLFFQRREDGLYFRLKKVGTKIFDEARELVKTSIIAGVSPGFRASPVINENKRSFSKIYLDEISLVGNPAIDSSYVHARAKDLPKSKKTNFPPEVYL